MTTDLKTNYDVERNTVLKKTNDNCRKQTELEQTEDDANNVQLPVDKGNTQRSNLNSKHLNAPLVVKYPDYFVCFYLVQ